MTQIRAHHDDHRPAQTSTDQQRDGGPTGARRRTRRANGDDRKPDILTVVGHVVLTLMCGLSFSGKSTLARQLAGGLDAELISLDAINTERGLDGGQGIPVDEWAKTNRIAHERATTQLRAGRDVVIDDTGSPRFIREEWRATASRAGAAFALVWVQIDAELQRERVQANRSGLSRHDVVDTVLAEHAAGFEDPVGEDPIVIDARDTTSEQHLAGILTTIRAKGIRTKS